MTERNDMHNMAETHAMLMLEPLHSIIFLVGLYKGSGRNEHLKCAEGWIPQLERSLESLKRELSK